MERCDSFTALLGQLKFEHQREVDNLRTEIECLTSRLDSCTRAAPSLDCGPLDVGVGSASSCALSLDDALAGVGIRPSSRQDPPQQAPQQDPQRDSQHSSPGPTSRPSSSSKLSVLRNLRVLTPGSLSINTARHHLPRQLSFRKEKTATSRNRALALVEGVVRSNKFEVFFSGLVALQSVVMAVWAHNQSFAVAAEFGYLVGNSATASHSAEVERVLRMLDDAFGVLFTLEIVLRIVGTRRRFVYDAWNWMDLMLVCIWLIHEPEQFSINPNLFRLARFAKLLRLVRLVRSIQGFDSLFLMVTSVRKSFSILLWTCCLLSLVLVLNALVMQGFLTEFYFRDTAHPFPERQEVFRYFGTFTVSLFSMFELTLANWPPISRALYENVSEWFILITLLHKITVGFALLGIINGVFMQETFKVAQQDNEVMLKRAVLASSVHAEKMKQLVATADESGDMKLDIAEFRGMFADPGLKSWLASMELSPTTDVDMLFRMMDIEGDGLLSVDEIIKGVANFKGPARSIDMKMLMHEHRQLLREHKSFQATVAEQLAWHNTRQRL